VSSSNAGSHCNDEVCLKRFDKRRFRKDLASKLTAVPVPNSGHFVVNDRNLNGKHDSLPMTSFNSSSLDEIKDSAADKI
jgi:hypothetical protein